MNYENKKNYVYCTLINLLSTILHVYEFNRNQSKDTFPLTATCMLLLSGSAACLGRTSSLTGPPGQTYWLLPS